MSHVTCLLVFVFLLIYTLIISYFIKQKEEEEDVWSVAVGVGEA
jgi:preprotein translocase subunit SecG